MRPPGDVTAFLSCFAMLAKDAPWFLRRKPGSHWAALPVERLRSSRLKVSVGVCNEDVVKRSPSVSGWSSLVPLQLLTPSSCQRRPWEAAVTAHAWHHEGTLVALLAPSSVALHSSSYRHVRGTLFLPLIICICAPICLSDEYIKKSI